ncbi:oxysterol-binding protein-related protein 3 isoform X1 [Phyllopteryx taeniolatus]|uniref:oxysterol-binding protein-related protein 3 isoform X1 n=1 Tax=Phyllopteryx taeniolatus TaxID=161469 RepID=UPI002AD483FC|nr:oxysterol-binding protein-related protein 3 isoform X1 [Phyllopteryx taeniolatus]XP_061633511.1 oxysterol-binding protein-related protein 3 isoform X1 [Phyllopteryx taeniolatus]XP_061633512.1 oxysterol-binding protein-related protein 3 isoform X1 [Phyllopteryx taeniolatus]
MGSEERTSVMSQKISSLSRSNSSSSSKHDSRQDSWEIVEGLRGGFGSVVEPQKQESYVLKKRKWPLKGWHKRYFSLDKGILKYGKCNADIEKGKLHGCIDVGLSVMAIKKKAKCIDLDAEENIYHLKIKSQELFDEWVSKLRHHRLYRQNEIAMCPDDKSFHFPHYLSPTPPSFADSASIRKCVPVRRQSTVHSAGAFPFGCNSQAKVTAWLQSSDDMDKCSKDLSVCEAYLLELSHLLQSMEVLHRTYSAPSIQALQASTFDSPKKEKRLQRKWRTKNYNKVVKTTLQVPSCISASVRLHASNPNLSTAALANDKTDRESLDSAFDVAKLQEDFCRVATNLHATMKSALSSLTSERERLKQCTDQDACPPTSPQVVGLKNALTTALAQNSELRERLCKIHAESHVVEPTVVNLTATVQKQEESGAESRSLVHQESNESRASIAESLSEFFDAQEVLLSNSSSENEASEDDSYISDVSDNNSMDNFTNETENGRQNSGKKLLKRTSQKITNPFLCVMFLVLSGCGESGAVLCRRRSRLSSPSPGGSAVSLWNILRNNIGKDLSKVAMPVHLNEPLNTLQRLCEELEYSELLDQAASTPDPFERMVFIATFVVSGYASSFYRTGGKPFNPVLGETYECDRPDKGFQFIAEQVSHHPPISACHAESKNFIYWQDVRCKNKFWGKSMEIVPVGSTHVTLPGSGDHYEWNKVTSCIHNILSGQRWIEHYGEISIRNSNSDACQCKITFVKARWNSSVNEVEGTITDQKGNAARRLFGKWHEAVYCGDPPSATCIWRANAMPLDHEQYYGFTKFAIELNELDASLKALLPPTDTRLRVDQRLLEEGKLEAAEEQKQRIEQLQRERRRILEESNGAHQPKFFRKSKDDTWVSNNTYWESRHDPGFAHTDFPTLW